MDTISAVAERLRASGIPFAVIGAAAMGTRGFARQTIDLDFLTTDRRVLQEATWEGFDPAPELRRGDSDDPLAGVVRFRSPQIDIVVGRSKWQGEAIERAETLSVWGRQLPVVPLADLILMKLDSGGYRDRNDIAEMLTGASRDDLSHIESVLPRVGNHALELWNELRAAGVIGNGP